MYKEYIEHGQVVRFKIIGSAGEKLNNHLEQLKERLVKRRYKQDHAVSEIERIKLLKTTASF